MNSFRKRIKNTIDYCTSSNLCSLRSAAQMVSYEVSIGFILINAILCVGFFNLIEILQSQKDVWYIIPKEYINIFFLAKFCNFI